MPMTIYVAGPVTGVEGLNLPAFEDAARALEEAGFRAMIPHRFVPGGADHERAMRMTLLWLLSHADGVCILDGWAHSRGAQVEVDVAMAVGLRVGALRYWQGIAGGGAEAPTDDERREVARRLRDVEKHAIPDARISDNPMTVEFIAAAAFYDLPYVRGFFSRLADLIEPSIPADPGEAGLACVDAFIREHTEKPVDRDALLALADEMDAYTGCDDERCGRVMPPRDIHDHARRIREACGEGV